MNRAAAILPQRLTPDEIVALPISLIALASGEPAIASARSLRTSATKTSPFPILPSRTIRIRVNVGTPPDEEPDRNR